MAENISLDDLKTPETTEETASEPKGQADVAEKTPGKQRPSWKDRQLNPGNVVGITDIAKNLPSNDNDEPPAEEDLLGSAVFKLDEGVDRYKKDITENLIKPQMQKIKEYNEAVEEIKDEKAMEELLEEADGKTTEKSDIKLNSKTVNDDVDELFDDDDIDTTVESDKDVSVAETYETESTPKEKPKTETKPESNIDFASDSLTDEEFEKAIGLDDDEDDDTDTPEDEESEEEQQKRLDEFKEDIKSKIHPIKKSFDLSEFTISRKPISAAKILNAPSQAKIKTADWALLNAKKPIAMTELSGIEIEKLNTNRRDRNMLNQVKDRYSIFYNHLLDDNKPGSLEAWLKLVADADIPEVFFCAYKATFEDTNLVPYSCDACKHTFMKEVPVDDMVEYPNDEVKKMVESIRSGDTTSVGSYKAKLVQITDEYVFAIKTPSIYTAQMEPAALDTQFVNKYSDLLGVITYIDQIFLIDAVNKTLIPIDYKPDRTDFVKTVKRKIVAYTKIINKFTVDQTYLLNKAITDLDEKENTLKYIAPETICPKCGAKIAKEERDPMTMLFTRRQLAALNNM